jgi:hypothetical protein
MGRAVGRKRGGRGGLRDRRVDRRAVGECREGRVGVVIGRVVNRGTSSNTRVGSTSTVASAPPLLDGAFRRVAAPGASSVERRRSAGRRGEGLEGGDATRIGAATLAESSATATTTTARGPASSAQTERAPATETFGRRRGRCSKAVGAGWLLTRVLNVSRRTMGRVGEATRVRAKAGGRRRDGERELTTCSKGGEERGVGERLRYMPIGLTATLARFQRPVRLGGRVELSGATTRGEGG